MERSQSKWTSVPLVDVLDYEQPNPYIIETPIKKDEGLFPVLTANKSFIKGYTDENKGVYKNVPVIIFDDFTADYKFVDFPFKVKSSAMKFLRPKDQNVSLKYIFYQMALIKVNTTTHKRYYISKYQNSRFRFPGNGNGAFDLKEQEQIVQGIETQLTRLDAAIKSLKTIKAKLEIYRQSVLKSAFEGRIIKISKLEEISVTDLGEIVTGTTPSTTKKEYYGSRYCFFKPTDLNSGYHVRGSREMLSTEGIKHARILPAKSILVTCIGATIGKTGFSRAEGATNQQINAVIPNLKKYCPEFLYYLFISREMQGKIIDGASSTTMPILNKSKFMSLKLTLPSTIEEQERIVVEIESRFSVIDKVEETVTTALLKAERLRKSILKAVFEGKLHDKSTER